MDADELLKSKISVNQIQIQAKHYIYSVQTEVRKIQPNQSASLSLSDYSYQAKPTHSTTSVLIELSNAFTFYFSHFLSTWSGNLASHIRFCLLEQQHRLSFRSAGSRVYAQHPVNLLRLVLHSPLSRVQEKLVDDHLPLLHF